MDLKSLLLILKLVSEVFDAFEDINKIIKRIQAGEVITIEEIEKARADVKDAVARWDSPKT
jgi:hypothetical protein